MKKLFTILTLPLILAFSACTDTGSVEPCSGSCPEGYECINDVCVQKESDVKVISGKITNPTTWTSDKIYELAGKVIVENTTLTIEPGTIIKGREGLGSLASALIIARGAKIEACGTAEKPIIFTSVLDNIKIGEKTGTNLDKFDNEKWGGVIILGNAPVSAKSGDTEGQIEGIPADEPYGKYGGDDENDNSGSLCYVSVRHGGALIGEGNEINGISLGGVGRGTTINHVEVVANLDDGIEFFGGTVNLNHVIICYQDDDGLDIDQNYKGTIDNFYIIHGGDGTDEGLEIDGPENSTYKDGKFTLVNGTIISEDGNGSCADLKSKAQGYLKGLSFIGYNKYVKVSASFDADNSCGDKTDAYTNLVEGNLEMTDCQLVSSSATIKDFVSVYTKTEGCEASLTEEYQDNADNALNDKGNEISSSSNKGANLNELKGWSWTDLHNLLKE